MVTPAWSLTKSLLSSSQPPPPPRPLIRLMCFCAAHLTVKRVWRPFVQMEKLRLRKAKGLPAAPQFPQASPIHSPLPQGCQVLTRNPEGAVPRKRSPQEALLICSTSSWSGWKWSSENVSCSSVTFHPV